MSYTGYGLLWLFFIYSFLGWILETAAAAIKHRRFVNKGLVDLPFCVFYGLSAIFITVFGSELSGGWLFIGSVISVAAFKWGAGCLIERVFHERWWDYSEHHFNLDGYISLPDSVVTGFLALVMVKWGNPLFAGLYDMLPVLPGKMLVWVLVGLLVIDIMATLIGIYGRSENAWKWVELDRWFTRIASGLGQRIHAHFDRRIIKAYPESKKIEREERAESVFAYGCCFYKLIWIFVIGSFLGDITETIFCRVRAGVWMSRSSLVWGPFSIVWGFAMVVATILLHKYQDKSDGFLFGIGTFLGGAYEYVCSVLSELVFGVVFWDYSEIPFNLGGRINLLYCFFWGIAAVVWTKMIYPKLSAWIERIPIKSGTVITWALAVFMCVNMAVSGLALIRSDQRVNGIPAKSGWQQTMDEHFDDARLQKVYPNMITVD